MDVRRVYMRVPECGDREKELGKNKQATKYPVYKDVGKLWSFDYAAEEKRRLKAELKWQPGVIPEEMVEQYLNKV